VWSFFFLVHSKVRVNSAVHHKERTLFLFSLHYSMSAP